MREFDSGLWSLCVELAWHMVRLVDVFVVDGAQLILKNYSSKAFTQCHRNDLSPKNGVIQLIHPLLWKVLAEVKHPEDCVEGYFRCRHVA